MDSKIISGLILCAMKIGAKRFKEIETITKLSVNTITKYTHDLEKEGLITIKSDKDRRKQIYELNEAKKDEIDRLIQTYLEYEKKEIKEKIEFLLKLMTLEERRDIIGVVLKVLERGAEYGVRRDNGKNSVCNENKG